MASQAQLSPAEKLIQRPLYVWDLPQELLYSLQLRIQSAVPTQEADAQATSSVNGEGIQSSVTAATSCGLCDLKFGSLQDQRSHVRSDLHGYNLKQKLRGKKAVTEIEFETLVKDLDESISGSDSSGSDESDDDEAGSTKAKDSTLSALLKRQAKVTDGDAEDAPAKKRKRGAGNAPLLWFSSSKLPSNVSLGLYRGVFTDEEQKREDTLVETIQHKQLAAKPAASHHKVKPADSEGGVPLPESMMPRGTSADGPHYFLCMIGGGHFAAMVVSLTPRLTKKSGVEDRTATVIAHKTFHRYTTRRKQGGSQSANDNAKGNAHSAGSSIRRQMEVALTTEVRALLTEWKELIDSAELLFVRASGQTNRRTLFGPYEDQVITVKDQRLRSFPFNTRRATQSELMRAFMELTRLKVSTVDEAALAKQEEEEAAKAERAAEAAANSKASAPKPAKPSKEDEEAALHTTQLQALIRRSKAPAMLSYLQSNKLSPEFRFFPADQNHHAPTPLHLAASSNSPACVTCLLVKAHADPTKQNGDGKTAFDLAGDRPTRDAFRLARSQLGENAHDWDAAGVPAALLQAEVDARTAREKESAATEAEAEKARRKAEVDRLRQEDKAKVEQGKETKFGKGNVLQAPAMSAEERRAEQARGMTDEMRMRLEREKRARAAEERMKRLQGR